MKKLLTIILFISVGFSNETSFTKTFEGIHSKDGISIQQTIDNGYIICGWVGNHSYPKERLLYLLKTNTMGEEEWSKTFPAQLAIHKTIPDIPSSSEVEGDHYYEGTSVLQLSDGSYIVTGFTNAFGKPDEDVFLLKIDAKGNKQWIQPYGGAQDERGYNVRQTKDGGFIIVGSNASYSKGLFDIYLIKTDSNGKKKWHRTFGGKKNDGGYSVEQTEDGGYIILGYTNSNEIGSGIWLIKTDSNGKKKWHRTFDEAVVLSPFVLQNYPPQLLQDKNDDGFIIFANTYSGGTVDNQSAHLLMTDSDGIKIWDKIIPGVKRISEAKSIQQTSDGGFIILYDDIEWSYTPKNTYLLKTDSKGSEEWRKVINTNSDVIMRNLQITKDGGYVMTGMGQDSQLSERVIKLIKTDQMGNMFTP